MVLVQKQQVISPLLGLRYGSCRHQNVEKSLELKRFKFTLKRVNRLSLPNIIRYIVPQICYPIKINRSPEKLMYAYY